MKRYRIILILILFLAFLLRSYGINWDQGFHLHPDERELIFVAERIRFFSNLNPHFFNYGSLPVYLLAGLTAAVKLLGSSTLSVYMIMLYVGRFLSLSFDLGTVLLVYFIGQSVFGKEKIGIATALLYSLAFFPIQNSHFFTVDPMLTFLFTLFVYWQIRQSSSGKHVMLSSGVSGILLAAMITTKFTAVLLYPAAIIILLLRKKTTWKKRFFSLLAFHAALLATGFLCMPYAFLEFHRFSSDISAQLQMNGNPFIFPYTLQYAGTLPYFYYLKNITIWGLGPGISILFLAGIGKLARGLTSFHSRSALRPAHLVEFTVPYIFYFVIIGYSAVKFMRYMLPVYPFFAIIAGSGLYTFISGKNKYMKIASLVILVFCFAWTISFNRIYQTPNTRILATEWILKHVPLRSTIAVEHWDDRLPLVQSDRYYFQELPLYNQPDNQEKWNKIHDQLDQSDYLIIASNRLYVPIQKLRDCSVYPQCFPMASKYYDRLFSNRLSFRKVAEFSDYPGLDLFGLKITIDDQSADESFTVYDHPRIMIYKKISGSAT